MNAIELADMIDSENWVPMDEQEHIEWEMKAATMLRQQALEIQALHQILGYEGIKVGNEYLAECVADLRKAQEK